MSTTTTHTHPFEGFTLTDFNTFSIDGLEPRMTALIDRIRPKLHLMGDRLSPYLSVLCGEEMFPHVARHARRTINPPNDTWVAFANNKRGYKAHPHFQIGLFGSHLFVQFAIIYESDNKTVFADNALRCLDEIVSLVPGHFVWSGNHMIPGGTPHCELSVHELETLLKRLKSVKASEALCGLTIDRHDPLLTDGERLIGTIEETFATLLPLYRLAF
ncbi:YktB family protein [Paenibacillus tarimensis]